MSMSKLVDQFSHVLRQAREERGWSQEKFAERADLNRSYLGEIERGRAIPSLATIGKLATALDLDLSTLITRCEQLRTPPHGENPHRVRL